MTWTGRIPIVLTTTKGRIWGTVIQAFPGSVANKRVTDDPGEEPAPVREPTTLLQLIQTLNSIETPVLPGFLHAAGIHLLTAVGKFIKRSRKESLSREAAKNPNQASINLEKSLGGLRCPSVDYQMICQVFSMAYETQRRLFLINAWKRTEKFLSFVAQSASRNAPTRSAKRWISY